MGRRKSWLSIRTFFIFPNPPQSLFWRRRVLRLVDCASEWGENLRYLVVSTMDYPEIAEYPDSNKVGAYVTSASPASSRDFRALFVKDSSVPNFEGETCSEIESIKKSPR